MASIGAINGLIRILYDGRGVGQANRDVGTLGKSFNTAGNVAGAAGAGIAAGLGIAVNAAANFEKSISSISAVTGASAGEMEKMRAKALQLGADTAFGASDAADAMGELAKAGLSTTDILSGAADATVALAAAGEVELPYAATIAANAMNQFADVTAKTLPKAADIIAGAANASAISVHDFGMSLSQVGAVANVIGFNFEDTAGAIALLGNAGIKGSDAGTSLKTMFLNLQPITEKQISTFEKLGLSQFNAANAAKVLQSNGIKPLGNSTGILTKQLSALAAKQSGAKAGSAAHAKAYAALTATTGVMSNQFFDAQGNVKSMSGVFGTLNEALKGQTKEQKVATLETIFGTDAMRASAIAAELGKGGFDNMAEAMRKVSAEAVAAERLNNLKGDLEKLKGSAETVAITVGTALIPILRDIAVWVDGVVDSFNKLDPATQQNIVSFLAWSAGGLLAFAALVKLIAVTRSIVAGVKGAIAVYRTLAAVIRLNGGMALFMAKAWATAAIAQLRAAASATVLRARTIAAAAAARIAAVASAIWAAATSVLSIANLRAAASSALATVAAIAHRVATVAGAVATGIMAGVMTVLNVVMSLNPFALIVIAIIALIAIFVIAYKKSETFRNIVNAAFQGIKTVVMAVINVVKNIISTAWSWIQKIFTVYFNIYKTIATTVFRAISTVIKTYINIVKTIIGAVVNFVKERFNQFRALVGLVSSAFSSIVSAIRSRISAVIAAVTSIVTGVVNKVRGIRNSLVSAGRDMIQGLINGISGMVGAVMDKARSLADGVKNTIKSALKIGSPSRVMMELGINTGEGYLNGIEAMRRRIMATSASMATIPVTAATGGVSLVSGAVGYAGMGGNTTSVSNGPGVVLEAGAVQITAHPGMSPDQLAVHTTRRLTTTLATRTSGPRINVGGNQ